MSARATARRGASRTPLRLVHHHPGRIRVRAEPFHGPRAGALLARVREALAAVPGIVRVTHNPRTGSLLLEYRPGLVEPDVMLHRVADAAGLRGVVLDGAGRDPRDDLVSSVTRGGRSLNDAVHALTSGRADLRELIPAALAATAVYSLLARANGPTIPRWDSALYWSYTLFRDWHDRRGAGRRPEPDRGATAP